MVLLQGKLHFSKDPEGFQHFPGGGGVQHFPGGPNADFYRNPYNLCFPGAGGGPDPFSPSGSAHASSPG